MDDQKFEVTFDSGEVVEVVPKSRDIAKLERAGVNISEETSMVGVYAIAFAAMQRMVRTGELDIELPDTAEALEDVADVVAVDTPGEGSGQVAVTG